MSWRAFASLLGLALALVNCGWGGPPETLGEDSGLPALPEIVTRVAEGEPGEARRVRELRIALVGEVRGEIEPCGCPTLPYGGYPRREAYLTELRSSAVPVFHLDAGETLLKGISRSNAAGDVPRARTVLGLMADVGVDVMVPGPSDLFALGLDELQRVRSLELVSATWKRADGRSAFPTAVLLERKGVKLGVIGLSRDPGASAGDEVVWVDPVEAARAALPLVAGADLVVAVSNLEDDDADRVAAAVPELAAILSVRGASTTPPRRVGEVSVIETPSRGRYVTLLTAWLATTSDRPLELTGAAHEIFDQLTELRGNLHRVGDRGDVEARRAMQTQADSLTAELERVAVGRNLGLVEDRPLGTVFDRGASSVARLEAFKRDVLQQAATTVEASTQAGPDVGHYASAATCVGCHTAQSARWMFTPHKDALQSLVERGATQDPECIGCHTTGFGEPGGLGELSRANLTRLGAVQCEACHGPLSGHPDEAAAKPQPITEETCLVCHDEANSPQFDFETYLRRVHCPRNPEG